MNCVHRTLARETCTGVHHYNCTDSRLNRQRPKEEWVAMSVPPIIEADVFARVKVLLHQRRPTEAPTLSRTPGDLESTFFPVFFAVNLRESRKVREAPSGKHKVPDSHLGARV